MALIQKCDLTYLTDSTASDRALFSKGPLCWGPNELPLPGQYKISKDNGFNLLLINDGGKVRVFNNACTHKGAQLCSNDKGDMGQFIVCPVHKWCFNLDGTFRSARGFDACPEKNLEEIETREWNGMLWANNFDWMEDIDQLGHYKDFFDLADYKHVHTENRKLDYHWRTFYEIFLDLYHVQAIHPGLRSLVDTKSYDWKFAKDWSLQIASLKGQGGDEHYSNLYNIYKQQNITVDNEPYGSLWLGIYPNIMLEYYPGCLVISKIFPEGNGCNQYLDFYMRNDAIDVEGWQKYQIAGFDATSIEDDIAAVQLEKGRRSLLTAGHNTMNFFNHPVEEAGLEHWLNWMKVQGK